MKKYTIKIFLIASVLFGLVSCDRDLAQVSSVSEAETVAMTSESAFRQAVDGAYTSFKGAYYYSGDAGSQIIMADVISDNAVRSIEGRGSNAAASNFEFSSDNSQTVGLYSAAYNTISRANFVLKHINNGTLTGEQKNNIEAESRAIRAIAHFDLVRSYCKIPTQSADANSSMGIYYSEKFDATGVASRNLTVAQVYDKIISDLLFAADNITQNDANKGRLSKASIYGLLSRVYLYKGDYPNTITYGNKALAISPSITTRGNFTSIWKSSGVDGVLFQVLNSPAEGVTVGVAYSQQLSAGYRAEYVVDYNFFNSYNSSDIRKSVYYTTSNYVSSVGTKPYNHITKYSSIGGAANVVPIKYIRTAEVLLNVAEAYYKSSNELQALTLLNQLRSQRYSSYVAGSESGTSLLSAILNERRFELAFENDRWYTLKRLGLPVQRSGKGHFADGTGTPSLVQILSVDGVDSYKWQWPIPITAIQANPSIVQNPKY